MYFSASMRYSITLDYRKGTKKPLKELRVRVRSTTDNVDVRKVTGIKVLEKHFNIKKQTLSVESEHFDWFNELKKNKNASYSLAIYFT